MVDHEESHTGKPKLIAVPVLSTYLAIDSEGFAKLFSVSIMLQKTSGWQTCTAYKSIKSKD